MLAIAPRSIAPPREHFELGAHVAYHHRVCVARIPKVEIPRGGLFDTGTTILPAMWSPVEREGGRPPVDTFFAEVPNWWNRMPINKGINKTLMVWPEDGEGYVMGLIRRGIGVSVEGYTSGYEYPEYEPGYFEAHEWHWLYAVKTVLSGLRCIYVPMWAAREIRETN